MEENGAKRIYNRIIIIRSLRLLVFLICANVALGAQADSLKLDILAKAQSHLNAGRYKAARIGYSIYLKTDSTSYSALYGMAKINAFEKRYKESIWYYNAVLRHFAGDPDAVLGRARVYTWQSEYEQAEKELISITKRFPDYVEVWEALGDLYQRWDKPDEAEEVYTLLITLNPENPDYYIKRGEVYLVQDRVNEARTDLERAVALGGDKQKAFTQLQKINRSPGQAVLNGGLSYINETFSAGDSLNWSSYSERVKLSGPKSSYVLHGTQTYRSGFSDKAIALDSYFNTWNNAYMNIYGQVTDAPNFSPYSVVRLEFFQGFGEGWETSIAKTRMNFPKNPVDMYQIAGAKYAGRWYLRSKWLWIPLKNKTSRLYNLSGRRFLKTINQYIEFFYGQGNVPGSIISLEDLSRAEAELYGITLQKKMLGQHLVYISWELRKELTASSQTISFGYWLADN